MTESNIVQTLLNENAQAAKIRSSMVDVNLFADVIFTFATDSEVGDDTPGTIKAHKVFLISASPVFFTMFCGSLPPTTNEVAIDDITRADFFEMLRHVYGSDSVDISLENVFGVWYAAQKYMLADLSAICEAYVCERVDGTNVLDIFNAVQLFDSLKVDDACLTLLLDSPYKYFESRQIEKFNKNAFCKFIAMPYVNCSEEFLKKIALEWLSYKKATKFCCLSDSVLEIFENEYNIERHTFDRKDLLPELKICCLTENFMKEMDGDRVEIECDIGARTELYGIGIYVGIHPADDIVETDEFISVEVKNDFRALKKSFHVSQKTTPTILRVLFENKVTLGESGKTFVSIRFPENRRRAINPMSMGKERLGRLLLPNQSTCLAYLIEKPESITISQ